MTGSRLIAFASGPLAPPFEPMTDRSAVVFRSFHTSTRIDSYDIFGLSLFLCDIVQIHETTFLYDNYPMTTDDVPCHRGAVDRLAFLHICVQNRSTCADSTTIGPANEVTK